MRIRVRVSRHFIRCAVMAFWMTGAVVANAERPNVVIVMTDDQGYPEVSAHGNPVLQKVSY